MGHIFLIIFMPGNFVLYAMHCEFYLVECCIFLYPQKFSLDLFWNVAIWKQSLSYSLYLFGWLVSSLVGGLAAVRGVFSLGLILAHIELKPF